MNGYHLLWLVDAAFALEEREEVPVAEFDPSADASARLVNPTGFVRALAEDDALPGTVLFYERLGFLPSAAERDAINERFALLEVLFDEDGVFPERVTDGIFASAPRLEGLYLMEGRVVRHRFLNLGSWEIWNAADLIIDGARAFLAGAEPEVAPVAAAVGAEVPTSVRPVGGPLLVLRLSGGDAAPEPEAQAGDGVGLVDNSVFLLEALPPLLERYGVQGVGLVPASAASMHALADAFPSWRFVVMDEPADWLTWLETQALVIDSAGEVQASFILFQARPEDPDLDALERALQAVWER